jgi:hypothetical protein
MLFFRKSFVYIFSTDQKLLYVRHNHDLFHIYKFYHKVIKYSINLLIVYNSLLSYLYSFNILKLIVPLTLVTLYNHDLVLTTLNEKWTSISILITFLFVAIFCFIHMDKYLTWRIVFNGRLVDIRFYLVRIVIPFSLVIGSYFYGMESAHHQLLY